MGDLCFLSFLFSFLFILSVFSSLFFKRGLRRKPLLQYWPGLVLCEPCCSIHMCSSGTGAHLLQAGSLFPNNSLRIQHSYWMWMILAVRPRNGKIPQITDACYCSLGFGSVLAIPLASDRRFSSGQKSLDFFFIYSFSKGSIWHRKLGCTHWFESGALKS